MTEQFSPITPPPELVQQWRDKWPANAPPNSSLCQWLATQAANWGADQELEACCEVLARELICDGKHVATDLRAVRRPKPPSLKAMAIQALDEERADMSIVNYQMIRSVLEALDD